MDCTDEIILSAPLAPDTVAIIRSSEYQKISQAILLDQELHEGIVDFYSRWDEINRGDDPLAHVGTFQDYNKIREIIRIYAEHPDAADGLYAQLILAYGKENFMEENIHE